MLQSTVSLAGRQADREEKVLEKNSVIARSRTGSCSPYSERLDARLLSTLDQGSPCMHKACAQICSRHHQIFFFLFFFFIQVSAGQACVSECDYLSVSDMDAVFHVKTRLPALIHSLFTQQTN